MKTPEWQADFELLIKDAVEESLTLDYKAADSLTNTDGKKKDITKDVSAMANSAGGLIIYGVRESSDPALKHKPEALDPIDRTVATKEWLEHVINNIRPRLTPRIVSVQLNTGQNDVAYVVEVQQSDTAHQAMDFRYYRRFNFESVPMHDYEIRDVMGRAKSAAFDVWAQIHLSRGSEAGPGYARFRTRHKLCCSLENKGPITGYDVVAVAISAPNPGEASFDRSLWDDKRQTQNLTLISRHPFHAELGQPLAEWLLNYGLSSDTHVQDDKVVYDGGPVLMQVRVFARDQIPATAVIEYSKEEIQNRVPKKFSCKVATD